MSIKKVRIILTYTYGVILFIGLQLVPAADTGEKATLVEALAMGLIMFILLYVLFSDWMYHNHLIDNGMKIKYDTYQKVGLATVVFCLSIFSGAIYNGLYDGKLGVSSIVIELVLLYFLIIIFSYFKKITIK